MASIQQTLHGTSHIRMRPLFIILVMHILFFMALSHNFTSRTEKDESGTVVTFMMPVMPQADPLTQKIEHRKAEHQDAEHQKPPPVTQKESAHLPRVTTNPASVEKLPTPPATAKSFADITAGIEAEVPAKAAVSLAQLRSQATSLARESAQAEASESGYTGILGDYYGSYSGADTGTFYIHVDRAGNIFGSADSGTAHSSFTITGKVSTDGVVQMTGKGLAGSASFDGKINLKSGAVSGHWNLTGFGRGQFAGQRAKAFSGKPH
ncbi:MAG: cell envelope integrity protein TolA [Burkholderiales bacterium]|nr:cell envelope integrity protein TolA [Burkholderiales bacterium]